MIVIGDGTPDDHVMAMVCYHVNGRDLAWIVKPEEKTGLASLELVTLYVEQFKQRTKAYLFLVDQEELSIEDLFGEAERRLTGAGVELVNVEHRENRIAFYRCRRGPNPFGLILVVNGLDEILSTRHTVEDHLAAAGGLDASGDSKDSWLKLDRTQQERVYHTLLSHENARRALPQHFLACDLLQKI